MPKGTKYTGPGPEFPDEDFLGLPESGYIQDLPDFTYHFLTQEEKVELSEIRKTVLRRQAKIESLKLNELLTSEAWEPLSGAVLYARLNTEKPGKRYVVVNFAVDGNKVKAVTCFASRIEEIEAAAARQEKDAIEIEMPENVNPYEKMKDALMSYLEKYQEARERRGE